MRAHHVPDPVAGLCVLGNAYQLLTAVVARRSHARRRAHGSASTLAPVDVRAAVRHGVMELIHQDSSGSNMSSRASD